MNIIIRLENENDYREVENLIREAFWDLYHPGCSEHLIVHKIRGCASFLPELDLWRSKIIRAQVRELPGISSTPNPKWWTKKEGNMK